MCKDLEEEVSGSDPVGVGGLVPAPASKSAGSPASASADNRAETSCAASGVDHLTNGSVTALPPPLAAKLPVRRSHGSVAGTTDESDDNEVLDSKLGDRYCTDCEIQFKSFKTFKVRTIADQTLTD